MRACPRCKNQNLTPYSLSQLGIESITGDRKGVKGLVVDLCPKCEGLFFDAGEAELLVGTSDSLLSLEGARLVEDSCKACGAMGAPGDAACSSCQKPMGLACPGCNGRMLLAKILGVSLDVCQSCQALWFDEGEITKVQRRFRRRLGHEGEERQTSSPVAAPQSSEPPAARTSSAEPLPTVTCIRCQKSGLRPREVYKTKEGPVCRACMSGKEDSGGRGLSVGMMNDGGIVSNTVDAMVTLAVVDAIVDLFKSGK